MLDGTWGLALVAVLPQLWMQMDCVVAGDDFRASWLAVFCLCREGDDVGISRCVSTRIKCG